MTVVTREVEWDDESRERATRLHEYETGICTCGCGLPREEARDSGQAFKVDTFTCYAGRAIAKVRRSLTERHENDADDSWSDGVFFYAEPVETPDPTTTPSRSRLPRGAR